MSVGDSKCFSNMWLCRYPDGRLPLGAFPPRRVPCLSKGVCQLSGQALISFLLDHIVAKIGSITFASNSVLRDLAEDVHHSKVNSTTFQREKHSTELPGRWGENG